MHGDPAVGHLDQMAFFGSAEEVFGSPPRLTLSSMPLVSIDDLSIGFRGPSLLDGVSATIEAGQRIGVLGRNGAGKTTLMRLLDGKMQPDAGGIHVSPGAKIARLTQDVPRDLEGTVQEIVTAGQANMDDPE